MPSSHTTYRVTDAFGRTYQTTGPDAAEACARQGMRVTATTTGAP